METKLKADRVHTFRKFHDLLFGIGVDRIYSDRDLLYTSGIYRQTIHEHGILQSMDSAEGQCHNNLRC